MKTAWIFLVSFAAALSANAYYSKDSYEARVRFEGRVQVEEGTPLSDAGVYIQQQLVWLAGPLQDAASKAGPKGDAKITDIRAERNPDTGKLVFAYTYTGTMALSKSIRGTVDIYLPVDPAAIYNPNDVACYMFGHTYAYYWNPIRRGCRHVKNRDYWQFTGTVLEALPNTQNTFPEYERLATRGGELRIALIFGAETDANGYKPADGNPDYNARNFLALRSYLSGQGFQRRTLPLEDLGRECGHEFRTRSAFIEEFTRADRGRSVRVRLFWGVANLDEESTLFYCMVKGIAENGSMLLYNGHSRVGGLDFNYMGRDRLGQPIVFDTNQYQIFGFFGCSSYGYYNLAYMNAKATASDPTGSKTLDIITNAVAGFDTMGTFTMRTLAPVLEWSATGKMSSWQEILNSYPASYLTGVNGDNDNN